MNDNSAIVTAYVDAFNRGDLEGICRMFTSDAEIWGVLGSATVEQARPIWRDLIECLQIQLQIEDMICVGNRVAVRFTERGKSFRTYRGLGPTGRTYELTAMEWFEIRDNFIHRRWGARDSMTQSRQLGFVN